jgi:hypothetical protein
MGDPPSSSTAAGIAFKFSGAYKPPHPSTKYFQQGGDTIAGELEVLSWYFHVE